VVEEYPIEHLLFHVYLLAYSCVWCFCLPKQEAERAKHAEREQRERSIPVPQIKVTRTRIAVRVFSDTSCLCFFVPFPAMP
jgi:hypothetical protein